MFESLTRKYRAHRSYKNTIAELSRLSNRELSDIGINRTDISGIARDEMSRM